ncbi:MAG: VOC family protein [Candidatus Acidiferrales bacterium]
MLLNPCVMFSGRCEEAFKFYENCLGGMITATHRYEGTPAEAQAPPGWKKKILHTRLQAGNNVLMGSDPPPDRFQAPKGFSISLGLDTAEEAERAFRALAEYGTVQMPMQKTFFSERFGMLIDQFGIPWMVICERAT